MPEEIWKILIVDASLERRTEVCQKLQAGLHRPCQFVEAETAAAALRVGTEMADGAFHCVLLDDRLPDMTAKAVLAALCDDSGLPLFPAVVIVGSDSTAGRDLLRAGAQEYVGEDWMTAASLARAVENAIERFALSEPLRRSEAHMRRLLDNLFAFVGVLLPDGTIIEANRAPLEAAGIAAVDVIGKKFWDCEWWNFSAESQARLRATVEAANRGETLRYDVQVRMAGDTRVWIDFQLAPLRNETGKITHLIPSAMDITARRQVEQALREADTRKDNFIATLAHELRNPLAPIRNAISVLRRQGLPEHQLAWCRDVIDRQVVQMAHLLDDLLDVSRITRGKLTLRRERVELSTVIERAVEIARPLLDAGNHTLTVTLPTLPVLLDGDLTRLAQIFSNLLSNAAKYTKAQGRIALSAQTEANELVVKVQDNGIGIASEQLPGVFEMFNQVESALTRAQGGLGIGLSLIKGLTEMHGGGITAHSEGLGKGSEFVVRLPVVSGAPPVEQTDPVIAESPSVATSCRVLIADDLRDNADSLAILLKAWGNEVQVVYDGEQAVWMAETFRPDVALFDLGMPKLNGYEACQRIREQPWGGPIVFIAQSGWGQEEDRRRSREAGFDYHMTKPFDPSKIAALLRHVADSKVSAQ